MSKPPLILLALAACLACSPSAEPPGDDLTREELEALATLGYTDHADEPAEARQRSVTLADRERLSPGLTLITTPSCRAELIAIDGEVRRSWAEHEDCQSWADTELMPDGDLVALGVHPKPHREGTNGHYLVRISANDRIVARRDLNAHHHLSLAASGGLTVLTREPQRVSELGSEGLALVDHLAFVRDVGEAPGWSISLMDVYRNSRADFPLELYDDGRPQKADLFHSNTLFRLPSGLLLLTMRHQDCVALIDPGARKVVWEWGRGVIEGPHDATMLPDGNLLLFDNGIYRGWSRVVEVDRDSREIIWQYPAVPEAGFFSAFRGASQRLTNGNTLITDSAKGRVLEVTRDGSPVWEYWNPRINPEGRRQVIHRARRHGEG